MPLDTPVLKVSRPVAACARCRSAKIKCDGKLPACTSCERSGRAAECTSTNDQFARGKERSYVLTLETKLERLQARLEEARARKPSVVDPDEDMTPTRRQSQQIQDLSRLTGSRTTRRRETTAIDDLVSDFGFLSVNATARDFYGFTSAMSYARLILWACSKDPLPDGIHATLPPRHVANSYIQNYLNNVYILLPVFDEASLYASVNNVYSRGSDQAEPNDQWIVRLVLAIACASMSEQRGDNLHMEAIGHICAALKHSEDVFHPGAISSIQALVLMAEFAMLNPHYFDSWGLIGAASRAMVDLGLHQDPPKGTLMPKAKLALRRRVYYCVYALDRSTSLVQARAFSFSDDSAKVKIPFQRGPSSAPTTPLPTPTPKLWSQSYDHALDLIKLRRLQSTWYTVMFQSGRTRWDEPYKYIWKVCDDMHKWFDALPASTSSNMRAFFELDLLYSYVYVLAPSPRVPVISPYARKLVFEYCILYVNTILTLVSDPSYASPLTFYDAMRVYMTGGQFLDLLKLNMDDVLGHAPAPPETRQGTTPPLPIPHVTLPPGDSAIRFNTIRSITCIKQITEALSRFGIRWGFMSWSQRYQSEASSTLEDLNDRLRKIDAEIRPSTWQHQGSKSSFGSGHGGVTSCDPSQGSSMSTSSGHSPYQQVQSSGMPMQGRRQQSISVHRSPDAGHSSPPQYPFPDQRSTQAQYINFQPNQRQYQQDMQPQYAANGQHAQQSFPPFQPPVFGNFNFNQTPHVPQPAPFTSPQANAQTYAAPRTNHPTQQFAEWSGYGGPGGTPDMLDEENAIPPNSNPWNTNV